MTAGSIPAPTIIPLRAAQYGEIQKFLINTNTLIEISCENSEVDIYYTLDGTKPDSFTSIATRRSTIQFKKPFRIPKKRAATGRVTIKAIAVSKDGIRESVVVTKIFDVEVVENPNSPTDDHENRYLFEIQEEKKEMMRKIHEENELMKRNLAEKAQQASIESFIQEKPPRFVPPDPQTQAGRLQKQTDFLRCSHCFAPRTTDLHARFCTECGLPWQPLAQTQARLNQSDASSLGTCAHCKSTVPFNSDICVVCETPLTPEHQHRIHLQNQTKLLCPQCKATNPVHLRNCMICESRLLPTTTPQVQATVSVPVAPKPNGTMMTCSKCFRLNNADARFCDWCGAQPEKASMPLQCTKCRSENDPYAKYCTACGCVIEPPLRVIDARVRSDLNVSASSVIANTLTRHTPHPTWLNGNATYSHYRQPYLITKSETATQTHGIFYPSAKEIEALMTQNKQLQADRDFKERRPMLTAISPGKGYWRQQVDHVCAHLKAFAVNQPDFRSLIGEPRLGKMVQGHVRENEYQVMIQAVFRKPESLSQSGFFIDESMNQYPMNSDRSSALSTTIQSDDEYAREKNPKKKAKKKAKKRPQSAATAGSESHTNRQLLKLLETKPSETGKDTLKEIKQLLNEGANGNIRNKDGYTALQLAVRNGHTECVEVLIKDGKAKVDARGPNGTTALHECIPLGENGAAPLKILLKNGGDSNWKNDRKETVHDLATKHKSTTLLQIISTDIGQKLIERQERIAEEKKDHHYDRYARTHSSDGHRSS